MSKEKPVYGPDNPHPLSTKKTELVWKGKYDVGADFTVDIPVGDGKNHRPRSVKSAGG